MTNSKMNNRILVAAVLITTYVLVPLLFGGNSYLLGVVVSAFTIAGIAVAWALLGNLGGMISFGHAAFFGIGAYTSSLLAMRFGVSPLLGLLLGGLGAVVASLAMLPVLRLRGPYFALAILAYAEIFRILAVELKSITGGAGGLLSIPGLPTVAGFDLNTKLGGYFTIVTIVAVSVLVYYLIRRSTYGLALRAMHDSENATRVLGVPATRLKALMLIVSAFITGVVGAFNAHFINFLEPNYAFAGTWTILPIVAAIFGGYRTLTGPVAGALVIYLMDQLLFKSLIPQGHQLILGGLLVAMILFAPDGLVGVLLRKVKGGGDHATT